MKTKESKIAESNAKLGTKPKELSVSEKLDQLNVMINNVNALVAKIYVSTRTVLTLEEASIYSGLGDEIKKAVEKKTIAYSVVRDVVFIERAKLDNWIMNKPDLKIVK